MGRAGEGREERGVDVAGLGEGPGGVGDVLRVEFVGAALDAACQHLQQPGVHVAGLGKGPGEVGHALCVELVHVEAGGLRERAEEGRVRHAHLGEGPGEVGQVLRVALVHSLLGYAGHGARELKVHVSGCGERPSRVCQALHDEALQTLRLLQLPRQRRQERRVRLPRRGKRPGEVGQLLRFELVEVPLGLTGQRRQQVRVGLPSLGKRPRNVGQLLRLAVGKPRRDRRAQRMHQGDHAAGPASLCRPVRYVGELPRTHVGRRRDHPRRPLHQRLERGGMLRCPRVPGSSCQVPKSVPARREVNGIQLALVPRIRVEQRLDRASILDVICDQSRPHSTTARPIAPRVCRSVVLRRHCHLLPHFRRFGLFAVAVDLTPLFPGTARGRLRAVRSVLFGELFGVRLALLLPPLSALLVHLRLCRLRRRRLRRRRLGLGNAHLFALCSQVLFVGRALIDLDRHLDWKPPPTGLTTECTRASHRRCVKAFSKRFPRHGPDVTCGHLTS